MTYYSPVPIVHPAIISYANRVIVDCADLTVSCTHQDYHKGIYHKATGFTLWKTMGAIDYQDTIPSEYKGKFTCTGYQVPEPAISWSDLFGEVGMNEVLTQFPTLQPYRQDPYLEFQLQHEGGWIGKVI